MIGEKHIKREIKGTQIVSTSEFKEFNYNYLTIAETLSKEIDDDSESLFMHGIYLDYNDFYALDATKVLDWVNNLIHIHKEEIDDDYDWLEEMIKPLTEAKGYTIYFNSKKDYYNLE